ncbi:hypothetical protein WMY93_015564 [Mugilogobius chulae]|uniref:C-C motif chemokine n=1 Tax=Mugilogobius chulae TaxID=88201 RepID=A0AAW0NT37_9GOBI
MTLLLAVTLVCCVTVCTSQSYVPDKCCFEFRREQLPSSAVVRYAWTSSHCARTAILFKMKLGKEFCVDPEADWVKKIVNSIEANK